MALNRAKGKLNNSFTHFGSFRWGEDPKIRRQLEAAWEKFWPAKRLKIKLGEPCGGSGAPILGISTK